MLKKFHAKLTKAAKHESAGSLANSEMQSSNSPNRSFPTVTLVLLAASLIAGLLAQTPAPSPSPSPSPEASPSVSPSPSPARTPSPTPLPGAQNFHQWGSITVFNGLPSDSVRAIAQTPDGVMWFGTDNGLARFDGRRIQNFSLGNEESKQVFALQMSPNGELWIGTSKGAWVYSQAQFQSVAGTETVAITAIGFNPEAFLGTDSGTVLRVSEINGAKVSTQFFTETIHNGDGSAARVTGLLAQQQGDLLVSSEGRGVLYVSEGGSPRSVTASSPSQIVRAIVRDQDSVLWLGIDAPRSQSGVFLGGPDDGKPIRIAAPTSKVLSLGANDSGVWAGTERYGLFHFADGKLKKNYTFENTSGGLRSNTIYALFTDREGVIWIGTNRGVSRFDRLGAEQETVSDIPNSNFIRALFRTADGRLYSGSNRGLFAKNGDKWVEIAAYRNKAIYALTEDAAGRLMAGTSERNADTRSFAHFRGEIYAAVSSVGLVQTRPGGNVVVNSDGSINSLAAAGEKLWIGTVGKGLFSFDGRSVKKELEPEVLGSGTIWKMAAAPDGSLWIAGQHGVFRVRNGQPERIVEVEDVRDVLIDGDHVWATTTTLGLIHIRRDELYGWLVSAFGFEQGLPSEKAFSIIRAGDGLLIGTNRGVVNYKAGAIAPKIIPVRVLSQRVHDLAELASTIALEYPQNSLLVEVAGQSSRTFPEEFQYAFVLTNAKGEEVDRRISNESEYAPADLAAGEYTIESIAFNRDLLASEPLMIRFSVAKAPFPWTATALAVLLFIALVGLVWAVVEHRRIKQRNRELAAARFDLANEAERERRRIARDLHDQTLADLRTLMIKSDKMDGGGNIEFRNEIEAVSTEIRRICEDLSPSVLENVGLVAALEFLLDNTVENSRFTAADGLEDRIGFSLNTQLQVYRIAQEVLTNIVRHSDADLVEMNVEATANGDLVLTVRDDGTSFQPGGEKTKGRGIANIRSRANLINARVAWLEKKKGGNVFSLTINGPDAKSA